MSATAQTLPIGGRRNWSKWGAGLAAAVALAVAAALLFNVVTGSGTSPTVPKVVPSEQIQAPTAPALVPTAGFHSGGPGYLRLKQYGHLPGLPATQVRPGAAPNGEPQASTSTGCRLCPR
jgi:hypothetical protein